MDPIHIFGFIVAAGLVALFYWAFARVMRTRFVVLYRSSGTDQLAEQLDRIATALEKLAGHAQAEAPGPAAKPDGRVVGSMFGR